MLTKKPINIQKKAVDSEEENDESQSFALQGWKMERPCKVFVGFFGFTFLKPRWFLGDRLASAAINIAYGKKRNFYRANLVWSLWGNHDKKWVVKVGKKTFKNRGLECQIRFF